MNNSLINTKIYVFSIFCILMLIGMVSTKALVEFANENDNEKGAITDAVRSVEMALFFSRDGGHVIDAQFLELLASGIGREKCAGIKIVSGEDNQLLFVDSRLDVSAFDDTAGRLMNIEAIGENWKITIQSDGHIRMERHWSMKKIDTVLIMLLDRERLRQAGSSKDDAIYFYLAVNALILATIGFFRLVKNLLKPLDSLKRLADNYLHKEELISPILLDKKGMRQIEHALHAMFEKIGKDKTSLKEKVVELETLNTALKKSQQSLIRSEKLVAVGRLSAGLAHEIGNPLGIIQGYIELLDNDNLEETERKEYVDRATKELDRIDKMIRQLLNYARKSDTKDTLADLQLICSQLSQLISMSAKGCEVEFVCNIPPESSYGIGISHNDLYQVLMNSIFNSIDAIRAKGIGFYGVIELHVTFNLIEGKTVTDIHLIDNGIGVPEEELDAIWDLFYTTKEVGHGTGLGLSVSRAIIEANDGTMELYSEYTVGSRLEICLPARDDEPKLSSSDKQES